MCTRPGNGRGGASVVLVGGDPRTCGRPLVAAGLDRGWSAFAEASSRDVLAIKAAGFQVGAVCAGDRRLDTPLHRAFGAVCELFGETRPALSVTAIMETPEYAGLGSRAALGVAIIRAMDSALGVRRPVDDVVEASLTFTKILEPRASCKDAMAGRGGITFCQDGRAPVPILFSGALTLVVARQTRSWSTDVRQAAKRHVRSQRQVEQLHRCLDILVRRAVRALESGEHEHLGQLMDLNDKAFNAVHFDGTWSEEKGAIARAVGALGVKRTGPTNRSLVALAKDAASAASIARTLSDAGCEAFVSEVRPAD